VTDIPGRKRIYGYEVLILAIRAIASACAFLLILRAAGGSAVPRGLEVDAFHRRVFLQARLEPCELRIAGVAHQVDHVIQVV
jgi:hypothetical protein